MPIVEGNVVASQVPLAAGSALPGHDQLGAAARSLRDDGFVVLPAATQSQLIGTTAQSWARFDRHWDELTLDTYMKDGGTYRYRRYGRYALDGQDGSLTRLPHDAYFQAKDINTLNGGIDRHFDPLTDGFAAEPLVTDLVRLLGGIVAAADGVRHWQVELHPFRIISSPGQTGRPAPQGRHRDGIDYVTSLVVGRHNIVGGESSVYTDDGERQVSVTLDPGDQLLLCDRRMLHDVTPVLPIDPALPAHRDVLLVDFTLPGPAGPTAKT
jgi:hypothetical protein